jgi:predicted pyridoxine 5'-phosphate oxidase superfamily flavin-nucleotide-binding protein
MDFYTPSQRAVQQAHESVALAQRMNDAIVSEVIDDSTRRFIEKRDFFFLSTVNGRGEPTVSYKGGPVGVVSVLDPTTLVFPIYDGNGMFLSVGNIEETAAIGLLFIDFETPRRVRVQARASTTTDAEDLARYPGAIRLVRATVTAVFVNCARLIHKHRRVETSPYVPSETGDAPLPSWKRIDGLQDVLPADTLERVESEGGPITNEEYGARLLAGES